MDCPIPALLNWISARDAEDGAPSTLRFFRHDSAYGAQYALYGAAAPAFALRFMRGASELRPLGADSAELCSQRLHVAK